MGRAAWVRFGVRLAGRVVCGLMCGLRFGVRLAVYGVCGLGAH